MPLLQHECTVCTPVVCHPVVLTSSPGEWYGRCGAAVVGWLTSVCMRRDDTDLPVAHQPRDECGILCS